MRGEEVEAEEDALTHSQLDMLLTRLERCVNRVRADELALDFCYFNSRGARKRLVRELYMVPRTALELIPYYARITAQLTLKARMRDVGDPLVDSLMGEFKRLQADKNQVRIETKVRNARFIGELTKFGVAPPKEIFTCIKACLDDFAGHNFTILATLLETAGRFLYRVEHTHARLANCLEIMLRLQKAKSIDTASSQLLMNAYYQCKPPERTARVVKEYPPLDRFIMKLIFTDLGTKQAGGSSEQSVDRVIRLVRRLPWSTEPSVEKRFLKCVLKVTRHRKLGLVADLLAGIKPHRESVVVAVVDAVLEALQRGLEVNDHRVQQELCC